MTDPHAIAASLTKAQRDIVVTGAGKRFDAAEVFAIEPSLFNVWNANEDGGAWLTGRTPLGLAVRAVLLAGEG